MPPRVSILTVCRNDAAHLARCLDSIAEQDWPDLEHVVQDGASTDDTPALLRRHAERVDVQLVSEPDGGIDDAFVRGLRRATGDIVGFVWADEALVPGAVRRAVEVLEARPELGGLYGSVIETDGAGRDLRVRAWPDWSFAEVFLYRLVPPLCATFLRRSVLFDRFLPTFEIAGDCFEWVLWLTVGAARPIERIPAPLARYAQREGQLSRQPDSVDRYVGRLTRTVDRLTAAGLLSPELAAYAPAVKANAHLTTFEWLVGECGLVARGLEHLEAALGWDAAAVRASAVPWAVARRLLSRGDGALALDVLDRLAASGAWSPAAAVLRGLARAAVGTGPADADGADLLERPDARDVAGVAAGIVTALVASGHAAHAERIVDLFARLAHRSPSWRLAQAELLAELDRIEEALRVVATASLHGACEADLQSLRARLEIALCLRDLAVRAAIGELAGRDGPIGGAEAAALARDLAQLVAARGAAAGVSPTGLGVVADLVSAEAHRRGFTAVAERIALLGSADPTFT